MSRSLQDFQPGLACVTSTATRLWSKAQGWTEGTTLGRGDGGALNPNGVVAGGGSEATRFLATGPQLPLGLEFSAAFWLILRLRDKGPAQAGNFRKELAQK
jgi:hypothetical protein